MSQYQRWISVFAACAGGLLGPTTFAHGGEPEVSVRPAPSPADGRVDGVIDIAATPARVWAVLTECDHATKILPSLTYCGILKTGDGGRWDVREHRVRWLSILPELTNQFHSTYTPHREIVIKRVGGDLRVLESRWLLQPIDGGQGTRLVYEATVGFGPMMPSFLIRNGLESDVPRFLIAIRDLSMSQAALAQDTP